MFYEISTIINPELDENGVKILWEKLESDIKSAKFKIEKKIDPFSRSFIYPIKKQFRGYFGTFYCLPNKEINIDILNKAIKNETNIFRSFIVKINNIPEIKPIKEKKKISKINTFNKKSKIISKKEEGFNYKVDKEVNSNKDKAPIEEIDKKLDQILDNSVKM